VLPGFMFKLKDRRRWTFKPVQYLDMTLLERSETDSQGNARSFSIRASRSSVDGGDAHEGDTAFKRPESEIVARSTFSMGPWRDNLLSFPCLRVGRQKGVWRRKGQTEMLTVLTIGHSTRRWKAFLDLLRAHRVKRVIDVRSIPRSRHNPQFNRETLRKKLRSARIGYVHLRKLGGLCHARRDSPNMGWRNASFRGFADHMQTSEFDAGLQRLIKLARQKRSALMCADAVPWPLVQIRSRQASDKASAKQLVSWKALSSKASTLWSTPQSITSNWPANKLIF
jgi:Protein of unknown function, DUF488